MGVRPRPLANYVVKLFVNEQHAWVQA
jgi:hypothetical protein